MVKRGPSTSVPRVFLSRAATTLLLAIAIGLIGASSCSNNSSTNGVPCEGGVVVNGVCEGKCTPEKCVAHNTCVDNACELECSAHGDCVVGLQDCVARKEDDTGKAVNVCELSGKATGFGQKCPFGQSDCSGTACPNGDQCDYTQCGGDTCNKDDKACAGVKDCTKGLCADGKTACTIPACGKADCKPMFCFSHGEGDADAYCTIKDCAADSNCPGGYDCTVLRDPHAICGSPAKPGGYAAAIGFCGSTSEPCIDPSDFTKNGAQYSEGPNCLMESFCRQRRACDTCQSDLDCSIIPGGAKCVEVVPGDKRCAPSCNTDTDCDSDMKCKNKVCVPKSATGCKGPPKTTCTRCQTDFDCAPVGPASDTELWTCINPTGDEHACVNYFYGEPQFDTRPACYTTNGPSNAACGAKPGGGTFHCNGAPGPTCTTFADCPQDGSFRSCGGGHCQDGIGCVTNADCPPATALCDTGTCYNANSGAFNVLLGVCEECTQDSDCPVTATGATHCMGTGGDGIAITNQNFHRCERCLADSDCSTAGPAVLHCAGVGTDTTPKSANFYHTCVECDSDTDCPTVESGLHLHCRGTANDEVDTTYPDFHRCYILPEVPLAGASKLECWK